MQPTILIGAGKSGRAIVDEAAALTQAHWATFAPGVVVVCVDAEAADDGGGAKGEERKRWSFTVTGVRCTSSVPDLAQAFDTVKAAFREQFAETTRQLLDAANLAQIPDPDPSVLQVFVVASLEEAEGIAWALPLAGQIATSVAQHHPTLTLRANGLWLLPEGAHPLQHEMCDVLLRFEQAQREGAAPYRFVWLFSPVNPQNRRLNEGDRQRAAAAFLLVHLISDLPPRLWHPDQNFAELCPMGSFSAVRLEFPADAIIAQGQSQTARQLIQELLKPDTRVWDETESAARWMAGNKVDVTSLHNDLSCDANGRPLSDEVQLFRPDPKHPRKKVPLIQPERVPMTEWVGLLVGFDVLYRRERLPALLEQVDAAAARRAQELSDALTRSVDALVESHRLPTRAQAFAQALFEAVGNVRAALGYDAAPQSASPSPEIPFLNELKEAIANLPSAWALGLRLALIAVVLWAPVSWLLTLLPRLIGSAAAIATQPLNAIAGALTVGLPLMIYGALRYHAATARIWDALRKVLDGMEENYRAELMNRVRQRSAELLNTLYCRLADEATLEREFKDYKGPNERRALQVFQEMLQQTPAQITDPSPPLPSAFCVSALDFVHPPPAFPYKEGNFTLAQEAQRFLEGGGYRQWRLLTAAELAKRLCGYAADGYDYVRRERLDAWMRRHVTSDGLKQLWRNIGPLCAPFLTLDVTHAQMPAVRRWLFVFPEAGEEFCDWLVDAPGSDWERSLTLTHPHWALLLTLQDHAECQRLRAWSVWSEEGGG